MAYSPYAHTTATSGHVGLVRLGSGVGGQADGSIVSNATLLGLTSTSVGLGNVTNESKTTMFTNPTFTGNALSGAFIAKEIPSFGTSAWIEAYDSTVTGSTGTFIHLHDFANNTDNTRFIVKSSGRVGVGTGLPGSLVHIVGAPTGTGGALLTLRDNVASGTASLGGITFLSTPGTDFYIGKKNNTSNKAWLSIGDVSGPTELVAIDSTSTTFSGLIYSSNDTTGGTGIALAPQVYTVGSGGYTPTTTTYPTVTQYFPVAVNLAPASQYEIVYRMWLDNASTNLSANWVAQFSQTPVLWNSYSRSSYSDSNDGTGDRSSAVTNKNTTTNLVGYSAIYMGTPHYLEVTVVVHTHATLASTMKLMLGTSTSGGMRLQEGSFVKVTKMPASVGTFS